jgi:small-conductance mechanosensitive channel
MGTPIEEPFRVLVWLLIGLPIAAVIVSIGIFIITAKVTYLALMWALAIAVFGYLLGIPWAIYRHLKGDTK